MSDDRKRRYEWGVPEFIEWVYTNRERLGIVSYAIRLDPDMRPITLRASRDFYGGQIGEKPVGTAIRTAIDAFCHDMDEPLPWREPEPLVPDSIDGCLDELNRLGRTGRVSLDVLQAAVRHAREEARSC